MYKKCRFDIEGMNCPSCAHRLQKHLKKLPGIKDVIVNLASAALSIEYNPDKISLKQIEEHVRDMGFRLIDSHANRINKTSFERRLKRKALINKSLAKRVIIMLVFFIPLLYIGMSPLLYYSLPKLISNPQRPVYLTLLEIFLSIPILLTGWNFIRIGWTRLIQLKPNVYSLIALGTTTSVLYSLYSSYFIIWEGTDMTNYSLYYLPACAILGMTLIGLYLENKITGQSEQKLRQLWNLLPNKAIKIENGREQVVSVEDLSAGDHVKISPGAHIPVDGIVIKGHSMVDESVFTGKETPLLCSAEDKVLAGMFNQEGYLIVEVLKKGNETFLWEIIELIEEGENSKPSISRIADRVSAWVIQVILVIAVIAAGLWYIFTSDYHFSINVFISVLVIACPVAIGLAVPMSVLFSARRASSLGILIRNISSFESLIKPATYIFNLTGTITKGEPSVTNVISTNTLSSDELLRLAASAESTSGHTLAEAIKRKALDENIPLTHPDPVRILAGEGIEAIVDDKRIDIGNRKLMELIQVDPEQLELANQKCKELSIEGKSSVMIAVDGVLQGIIAVFDSPRPETKEVMNKLKELGNKVVILTGEHKATARNIADEVGITIVHAEIQPANRARFIRKLQYAGEQVVMIGDGLNDAGALAQADAGIAIGVPDDIAADAADIVLLNKDLRLLITVMKLAEKTNRNMKENLFFAFIYNLLMIPVATGVFTLFGSHFSINPLIAVVAMFLGTLSVLLNALRLKQFK